MNKLRIWQKKKKKKKPESASRFGVEIWVKGDFWRKLSLRSGRGGDGGGDEGVKVSFRRNDCSQMIN